LVLTIAAGLLLRFSLAVITPPLFAADEAGHLLYIHEIAINHVLPVQSHDGIWANSNGVEDFYHTPLYYVLMSPIYRLLWPSHLALYAIRMASVGFGLISVLLIRQMVREHFPESPWAAEIAALFAAFQPAFVAVTSAVNNDSLSLLMMVLVLRELGRLSSRGFNARRLGWLCGLFAIALYVKVSALALLPAFLVAALFLPFPSSWRHRLLAVVPAAVGLFAVLPWLVLRNQREYGSLLALDMHWQVLIGPLWVRIATESFYMAQTFWFGLGRTTEILNPLWMTIPLSAVLLVCARRVSWRWRSYNGAQRSILAVSLMPLLAGFAQSLEYGVNWGYSQGRYLLPGLTFLSIVFGIGLTGSTNVVRIRKRATGLLVTATASWLIFAGLSVIPGFARVRIDRSVGGLLKQTPYHAGDLDVWVMRRTAPLRAEDACQSATHSPFSRPC